MNTSLKISENKFVYLESKLNEIGHGPGKKGSFTTLDALYPFPFYLCWYSYPSQER